MSGHRSFKVNQTGGVPDYCVSKLNCLQYFFLESYYSHIESLEKDVLMKNTIKGFRMVIRYYKKQ